MHNAPKHLQFLMKEIYKSLHNLNPTIINELFHLKNINYNMRNTYVLRLPPARTTYLGTNSLTFKGSYIWNLLSNEIETSHNLSTFLRKIKDLRLDLKCNCCICN